jgi:hypothetical protein
MKYEHFFSSLFQHCDTATYLIIIHSHCKESAYSVTAFKRNWKGNCFVLINTFIQSKPIYSCLLYHNYTLSALAAFLCSARFFCSSGFKLCFFANRWLRRNFASTWKSTKLITIISPPYKSQRNILATCNQEMKDHNSRN